MLDVRPGRLFQTVVARFGTRSIFTALLTGQWKPKTSFHTHSSTLLSAEMWQQDALSCLHSSSSRLHHWSSWCWEPLTTNSCLSLETSCLSRSDRPTHSSVKMFVSVLFSLLHPWISHHLPDFRAVFNPIIIYSWRSTRLWLNGFFLNPNIEGRVPVENRKLYPHEQVCGWLIFIYITLMKTPHCHESFGDKKQQQCCFVGYNNWLFCWI